MSSFAPASTVPLPRSRHDSIALLCAVLATASFISMDSIIKLMSLRFDALQLSFFRFAGGSVFAVALWLWKRSPLPRRAAWRPHLLRSALLLVSLVGYFFALTRLPLVQALTISYLAPIFVAVLSIPVLGERPTGSIWLALAAGLAGVVISAYPELRASVSGGVSSQLVGMVSAAVAALSFAGVMLLARRQSRTDSVWTILLLQSLLPLLLLAGPAAWQWRPLQQGDVGLILAAGGLGTLGLLSLTFAVTRLEASRVAPIEYTGLLWATVLGYVLFGELPTPATAASAVLVVGGCFLLLRR